MLNDELSVQFVGLFEGCSVSDPQNASSDNSLKMHKNTLKINGTPKIQEASLKLHRLKWIQPFSVL